MASAAGVGPAAATGGSVEDPVRLYLDAIGQTDLLTHGEEVDLAKRVQAGAAAAERLEQGETLSPAERVRLRRVRREGQRAHDHLVRANLRLVVSIARRYRSRGLDLLDLIQEGNLGLIRAVDGFDPVKGYRFSTYATWWIRQSLSRGLADRARTLRLPVHVHEQLARIRRVERSLEQRLGRAPSDAEVAAAAEMSADRLRELRDAARELVSLDVPVGSEGDTTMGQLLPDDDAPDPEERAAAVLTRTLLREVLESLSPRERGVVELRFGLVDGEVHTLEDVGQRFQVTRERIRQIEAKTMAKLRHPEFSKRLEGLLDGRST